MVDPEQKPQDKPTPPMEAKDKADLAAVRMMEHEKAERERLERERIMATATTEAAVTRAETTRTDPAAGERTTRQGAAVDTPPPYHVAPDRLVTGAVVPPGVMTTKPLKPYGDVDERTRMHAEDESVHPDWETQPQINAPRDVGVPTPEGQATARRIEAGGRRSDRDMEVDRGPVKAVKEDVHKAKEVTKETVRDVSEDIERKI